MNLSAAQADMMTLLAAGRQPPRGFNSARTWRSLLDRGLIKVYRSKLVLTEAGQAWHDARVARIEALQVGWSYRAPTNSPATRRG